jgi:transposase
VAEAAVQLNTVADAAQAGSQIAQPVVQEVVADKGYHSNETTRDLRDNEIRTYISEPDRGPRVWIDEDTGEVKSAEQTAVYANRRRIRGRRGKALLRKRGELLERPFAHCYETGGMRRTHLRGHPNILKRLLIHVAGFNLGLVMRRLVGIGKPRRVQDGLAAALLACLGLVQSLLNPLAASWARWRRFGRLPASPAAEICPLVAA